MKKLFSILLIISLLSMLVMPVVAENKSVTEDIRDLLENNYNGVETETSFQWFVVQFTVFKDKTGVINICAYDDDYNYSFGRIQSSNARLDEKMIAAANIKNHMERITEAVMDEYPGQKFRGWYESNKSEEDVFYQYSWTNVEKGKTANKVIWQPKLDSEWILK